MIPIRDITRARKASLVRNTLLLSNIGIFIYSLSVGPAGFYGLVTTFGFSIGNFSENPVSNLYSLISYQFLHGGVAHILGNMWYLWVFGSNVEARLGGFRFLIFYLFSGMISCMVQSMAAPYSSIPMVGASGSIAGILGAYAGFFPKAKIVTWFPFGLFGWSAQIRAVFFLALWFLYQFALGFSTYNPYSSGGVAWWAHVGGFLFGLLFSLNLRNRS